jgi:hypothetical protein
MVGQALRMSVELRRLRQRWQVELSEPPPIQLSPLLNHECIIEGLASTTDLDLDHVKLAPRALTWPTPVQLLIHHDFDRPGGTIEQLSYTKNGSVWAKCKVSGEGTQYNAFSVAFEIMSYELHDVDSPHFYSLVKKCELRELSLVTRPVNVQALVKERYPLFDTGTFYDLAAAKIAALQQLIKTMEGSHA